jgi:hypothetical protein
MAPIGPVFRYRCVSAHQSSKKPPEAYRRKVLLDHSHQEENRRSSQGSGGKQKRRRRLFSGSAMLRSRLRGRHSGAARVSNAVPLCPRNNSIRYQCNTRAGQRQASPTARWSSNVVNA